jgi:hypothetical protein
LLILDWSIQRLAHLTLGLCLCLLLVVDDYILLLKKIDLEPFDLTLQPVSFVLLACRSLI